MFHAVSVQFRILNNIVELLISIRNAFYGPNMEFLANSYFNFELSQHMTFVYTVWFIKKIIKIFSEILNLDNGLFKFLN